MGGILSAEVALLGLYPSTGNGANTHRILGTINLDTPFLGMHPGIVASGISSLFRPAIDTPGELKTRTGGASPNQLPMPMPTNGDLPLEFPSRDNSNLDSSNSLTPLPPTQSTPPDRQSMSPFLSPTNDPNYNPPFPNDVRMATRSVLANTLHFINKHSDGLAKATKSYVTSYFEFGGCMADYNGLKLRYSRLRALEDVDHHQIDCQRRIRFVNYYTASTGRPKKQKSRSRSRSPEGSRTTQIAPSSDDHEDQVDKQKLENLQLDDPGTQQNSASLPDLVEEHCKGGATPQYLADSGRLSHDQFTGPTSGTQSLSNTESATSPIENAQGSRSLYNAITVVRNDVVGSTAERKGQNKKGIERSSTQVRKDSNAGHYNQVEPQPLASHSLIQMPSLPPIPSQPEEPAPFDPSTYSEKDARKLAEKDYSRQLKAYQRAVKDRDKAIKDRRKLLEKRQRDSNVVREKQQKSNKKEIAKSKKGKEKSLPKKMKNSKSGPESEDAVGNGDSKAHKPKRDKKFCMLPSKVNGEIDPCWVRVYMRGVDEVGAHCGLFFMGEHYEWLVNDVAERAKAWVEQEYSGERVYRSIAPAFVVP